MNQKFSLNILKSPEETYVLGKQQCMDGIDEDHCEDLEYNECEENEYRCEDGLCIPEEYWLDGQYDCSDKSDEQEIGENELDSDFCPLTSSQFYCDEATTHNKYFACGDGQFVLDKLMQSVGCYNYRNYMFFCEFNSYFSGEAWTLDTGHCVEEVQIEKDLNDIDESQKCVLYLKCKLISSRSVGCNDVIRHFHSGCKNKTLNYPSGPFFKPYAQTVYELTNAGPWQKPDYVLLNGSIKCIGYQARFGSHELAINWVTFSNSYSVDMDFCKHSKINEKSGPHYDKNCWNNTKQSYQCQKNPRCISKHRLRNGMQDCSPAEDEDDNQKCYTKNKHRLKCLEKTPLCLLVSKVGNNIDQCTEGNDEHIVQLKWSLADRKCTTPNSIECIAIKAYIQSPSSLQTTQNGRALVFRRYCDTMWQLPRGFDESICNEWKCPRNEYQCLSGHCIPIHYVTDRNFQDWHCPDASDNIGLFKILQLSKHNMQIINDSDFESIKEDLIYSLNHLYSKPFKAICNYTEEYECILANVDNPLNFITNRPCINLTQIGDDIIDCYGGLDERNIVHCGNNTFQQRGFDFHCNDQECIPYHLHCEQRCSDGSDSLLCDELKTLWDPSCQYPTREGICDQYQKFECDLFDSKSYYCDKVRTGK